MSENLLLQLSILNIILPLFGFALLIFFGKRIPKSHLFEISTIFIGLILSVIVLYFKLSYYEARTLIFEFQWIDFGNIPFVGNLGINIGIQLDNGSAAETK